MHSKVSLATSIVLGLLLCSCLPPSDNPVDESGGSTVSVSPYLETWTLIEIAGESTDPGLSVEVVDNSGTYEARVSENEETTTEIFELAEVSGKIIVSLKRKENNWDILEAELQDGGETLLVRSMDMETVKAAIEAETLDGYILKWTDREKLLRITASETDLRNYIANETNLFVDLWKFEKSQ